jgi:hypothetical protein
VENIWQYLRQTWLSSRVFDTYEAVVEAACEAWNKLLAQPATIKSIGLRDWAHIGQCEGVGMTGLGPTLSVNDQSSSRILGLGGCEDRKVLDKVLTRRNSIDWSADGCGR